jgi:hypothetical protein
MILHGPEANQRAERSLVPVALLLGALVVAFLALGMLFAVYLAPWDAEWGYVTLGRLAIEGRIGLFQDEMIGERMPLPYYLIGLSQLAGPSLLAARVASLAAGALAVILTFRAGAAMAGPTCGLLAAAFLATHGVVVGYFAAASYFALCAALTAAGLAALGTGRRPWGSLLCMACFVGVAFARANLAVMAPFVFAYLWWTAPTRIERLALLAVFAGPAVLFFAWSSDHWKILAYVPVFERLVAPLGYRSGFALGVHDVFPRGSIGRAVAWFGRMHFFWLATGAMLAIAWLITRPRGAGAPRPDKAAHAVFCAALGVWTLAWQIVILRDYPKSVAAWVASFAPVWAIGLAWAACVALMPGRSPVTVRAAVAAAIGAAFAIGPSLPRHAAMPRPLPSPSTVTALEATARAIRDVVPPGARVFVFGNPLPTYLAGARPYLQQAIHPGTFVASTDTYAVSRSGMWGARELEEWLGREARYAVVDRQTADHLGGIDAYRPLVARMFALLDREFDVAARIASGPGESMRLWVYRRRGVERP